MSGWRLPSGGLINRDRPISFTWAGRRFEGFMGDTLASALLANGVDLVGRSFKYHRPRGVFSAGAEEPSAIVDLGAGSDAAPNRKASLVALVDGLNARPVNVWPSLAFDSLSVNGWIKPFIPAGFYYKTFKRPDWCWYEPAIRRAAGLGRAPEIGDPHAYAHRYARVDTLIIGGGVAGLAAALRVSADGRQTLICDLDSVWGGRLAGGARDIEGAPARDWIARAAANLQARPNVTALLSTQVFAAFDHGLFGLNQACDPSTDGVRERLWKVRARETILATGAIERPLVFDDNDRPGVRLADAARLYAERFAVAPGRRVVVATTSDSGYDSALVLQSAGVLVAAILDARPEPAAKSSAVARARGAGLTVMTSAAPLRVLGRARVNGVAVAKLDAEGRASAAGVMIEADGLLVSGGWSPTLNLFAQAGGRLRYDEALGATVPDGGAAAVRCVGAAAGVFDVEAAVSGADDLKPAKRLTLLGAVRPISKVAEAGAAASASAFVDLHNDVTAADIALAAREGYRSVEHLKRYTTLGMGVDQGKTSNLAGLTLLGEATGRTPAEVGVTRFRPPYEPVSIAAFAGPRRGEGLRPRRRTPLNDRLAALGARFDDFGPWTRAAAFPRADETEAQATRREALAVRTGVGLFDAAPLGKIEVCGPDAARFLDRQYLQRMSSLAVGRCRYGLMLTEHGAAFDDGVVARLAEDRFLVHTTSGRAAAVASRFEEWLECEWRDLRVVIQDVTTAWGVLNLAGPRSREVLAGLDIGVAIDEAGLPHMSFVEGQANGSPFRLARVSYTGERSYELSVPWTHIPATFDRVWDLGASVGLTLLGVEALMALRTEKGYLHLGAEADSSALPDDLGFVGAAARRTDDFIGQRSLARPDARRADRRQLVGLQTLDDDTPLGVGGHLITPAAQAPCPSQGWVTSSAWGAGIGRPVALAMVAGGRARLGETLEVWDRGQTRRARIVAPCAFDPEGSRLHG